MAVYSSKDRVAGSPAFSWLRDKSGSSRGQVRLPGRNSAVRKMTIFRPRDDVANAKEMASFADQERGNVGAVQDRAAAYRLGLHPSTDEKTAENRGQ